MRHWDSRRYVPLLTVLQITLHELTTIPQIYAAILTLSAVLHTNNGGLGTTKTHSTLVLLSLLVPHLLRNIWPLLTFSLHPQDAGEGVLLWIKIGLLVFAGTIIPLLQPFHYVPVDASVSPPNFTLYTNMQD
jgi:hypothetical protein